MTKTDIFKIIKLSLGSCIAILLASLFHLQYSTVAGVITLLVVKDTKKETLKGALSKLFGFILCTLYSYICFTFFGYNLFSFSVYTFITIATCFALKIRDVIPMCIVISSHYLLQSSMSFYWILNETGLFIIGAGIGIIINMFMPSNVKQIYVGQHKLQEEVSEILIHISSIILNPNDINKYEGDMTTLNNLISKSVHVAYENINNTLLSDTQFLLEHMEIIKSQRDILTSLYKLVFKLNYVPEQAYVISEFINKIGHASYRVDTITNLLLELEYIIDNMKKQPLPVNRDEFENRAILFLCLTELEKFLTNRKNAQILRDNYYYKKY